MEGDGGGGGVILHVILSFFENFLMKKVQKFNLFSLLAYKNTVELCVVSNLLNFCS